ncbi:hypothetical protein AcV7_000286 [Taiwanofungus camphoratus]|nr:hypothetical protein AcV7_000286 [Antrodia cinnamomea]
MPDSVYMPRIVPLDDKFYALDAEELAFYKAQTGIHDEDALKQHIMRVQADAYQVHPYNCIRRFNFTRLKISRLPAYSHLLKLGKERAGAIFLDIGCCCECPFVRQSLYPRARPGADSRACSRQRRAKSSRRRVPRAERGRIGPPPRVLGARPHAVQLHARDVPRPLHRRRRVRPRAPAPHPALLRAPAHAPARARAADLARAAPRARLRDPCVRVLPPLRRAAAGAARARSRGPARPRARVAHLRLARRARTEGPPRGRGGGEQLAHGTHVLPLARELGGAVGRGGVREGLGQGRGILEGECAGRRGQHRGPAQRRPRLVRYEALSLLN